MITSSPVVRESFESDVEELAPLFVASLDTSIPGVTFSGDPNYAMEKIVPSLQKRLFPPKSVKTYVLELPTGELVGYGNIKPDGGPNKDEPELDMFFVKAGYGGKGHGSQLMEAIQKEWKERGLWVHVFKKNARALRFYDKWGYQPVEDVKEEDWNLSLSEPRAEPVVLLRWQPAP